MTIFKQICSSHWTRGLPKTFSNFSKIHPQNILRKVLKLRWTQIISIFSLSKVKCTNSLKKINTVYIVFTFAWIHDQVNIQSVALEISSTINFKDDTFSWRFFQVQIIKSQENRVLTVCSIPFTPNRVLTVCSIPFTPKGS